MYDLDACVVENLESKKQKERAVKDAKVRAEQKQKDLAKAKADAIKAKEKAFKDKQLKVRLIRRSTRRQSVSQSVGRSVGQPF